MTILEINEGAGAVSAAPNPHDAKAVSPASPHSAIERLPPDGGSPCDAGSADGAELLDRVHAFLRRFICYPSVASSIAHVLWITHTHFMDEWFSTPRLAALSPEPGSGKSRLLEITALLVPRPILSVGSTASFILRTVADQDNRPTILYDEIDTVFSNPRGAEGLRGLFNAGYRRGATAGRSYVDKGKVLTERLATYAAVAMGGLGDLPDTIMSRSVVIRMRKRANGEHIEPFRPVHHEMPANDLHDELAAWSATVASRIKSMDPALPDGIVDRHADVWSPLLIVAELAGGHWPDQAKDAAIAFLKAGKVNERPSLGVQLLADVQRCFGECDRITTSELLRALLSDDEAPWGDLRGKKIDARILGQLLRPYGIRSGSVRLPDGATPKGYMRADFHEAWKRYLPAGGLDATSATAATDQAAPG